MNIRETCGPFWSGWPKTKWKIIKCSVECTSVDYFECSLGEINYWYENTILLSLSLSVSLYSPALWLLSHFFPRCGQHPTTDKSRRNRLIFPLPDGSIPFCFFPLLLLFIGFLFTAISFVMCTVAGRILFDECHRLFSSGRWSNLLLIFPNFKQKLWDGKKTLNNNTHATNSSNWTE